MKYQIAILFLLLVPLASAATITGNVYDFSLEKVEAIVEINTQPKQTMVAKESYSFQVPPGQYILTAKQMDGDFVEAFVQEEIIVDQEGDFIIDLILFPNIDENEFDLDDFEIDTDIDYQDSETKNTESETNTEPKKDYKDLIAGIFFVIIGIGIFLISKFKPKPHKDDGLDEIANNVLEFIVKNKRVTQKDIRKEFPFSEAKISLIITELEDKNLVKKIKKGRGNVIVKV